MKIGWFALLLLMAASLVVTAAAQVKHRHHSEQTNFSAEDEAVKNPVAIPGDVLAICAKTRECETYSQARTFPRTSSLNRGSRRP
jgi:hypothetical protein